MDEVNPYVTLVRWQVITDGTWYVQLFETELEANMYVAKLIEDEKSWQGVSPVFLNYEVYQYENPVRLKAESLTTT